NAKCKIGARFATGNLATALGYSNTSKAIQQHVDEEDKGTLPIRESAYETRAIVINESGLYSLILSSKLEQARAFKRWVTSGVLPAIRVTGVMMQLFLHLNYVRACFRSGKSKRTSLSSRLLAALTFG
ncbi:MAG: hypothetical protein K5945_03425, partial [Bacteroidaceae bacterium]|nr:hypothetical protein [Bacteroidaceae bacterium]